MFSLQRKTNVALCLLALLHLTVTATVACVSAWLMSRAFNHPFEPPVLIIVGWFLMVATAVYWFVPVMSVFQQIRRPIREEEMILTRAVNLINQQTANTWQPQIKLKDEPLIYAACMGRNTMIISTGSLTMLSVSEIAAVLAHEQAHLQAKDTAASATIAMTARVNKLFINIGTGLIDLLRHFQIRGWVLIITLMAFSCWMKYYAPFLLLAACIFPAIALIIFQKLMSPLELLIRRRTEYARDAYVHHIGLGEHLRSALLKTTQQQYFQSASRWEIVFRSTHPLTHDRIRRLDKLTMKNNYPCLN